MKRERGIRSKRKAKGKLFIEQTRPTRDLISVINKVASTKNTCSLGGTDLWVGHSGSRWLISSSGSQNRHWNY
jgi:hypothetical protein